MSNLKQELFDKVSFHLLTQKRKSQKKDKYGAWGCLYRGEKGTTCAIGCLIPDEEYDRKMEGTSVQGLFRQKIAPKSLKKYSKYIYLAQELQDIHDANSVEKWEEELISLANKEKLKTTAIELATALTKEYE